MVLVIIVKEILVYLLIAKAWGIIESVTRISLNYVQFVENYVIIHLLVTFNFLTIKTKNIDSIK